MDKKEVLILLVVALVAVSGLVLMTSQTRMTGQLISPQFRQTIFKVPNIELPNTAEPIEEPFAGRCESDRDTYITYLVSYKASVEYAFDGCYQAFDGEKYFYDFYCEGTPRMNQAWVRITPGCKETPKYVLYREPVGDYPY
ncbi:MAG: hypothetical protein HY363_03365 [Candidatus Aenigmarchaeota archaeon]|nr:hypothetical protein [Candidatus Aenigmarchaeota archaeon]